jgi:tetratricopeptide (TPR) repeat protein
MHVLEFEQALDLLTLAARKTSGSPAGKAGALQGEIFGSMATCHLESGRAEASLPLFHQAIGFCLEAGDDEGLVTNLKGLYEAHRYLGQGMEAAVVATECASALESLGRREQARRFRKVAEIARRGEPPNRVVLEIGGAFFELDEIPPVIDTSVHFIFHRDRTFLARAIALMTRGREQAMRGGLEQALPLLREACRIDPHAPGPLYVLAATLMHLERVSEALACYTQLEALAPGWQHCRADRWLAAGIAAGRIPHSAFTQICTLEDWTVSAEEQVRLARQGLGEAPTVPAFHLYLGIYLDRIGQRDEARRAVNEGLVLAEEPDLRSRLLLQFALLNPDSPERDQRLHEAMAPGGNLAVAAMAAVTLYSRKTW